MAIRYRCKMTVAIKVDQLLGTMDLPTEYSYKISNLLKKRKQKQIKLHDCIVKCAQYSIWLEALGYLCTSCLYPAFDEAYSVT